MYVHVLYVCVYSGVHKKFAPCRSCVHVSLLSQSACEFMKHVAKLFQKYGAAAPQNCY